MSLASVEDGKIVVAAEIYERDLVAQVPGSNWDRMHRVWRAPLAWPTCLMLRSLFGQSLEVHDSLLQWSLKEYEQRIRPALEIREAMELPSDHSMACLIDNIERNSELKLKNYQRADAAFMAISKQCLLANDVGLGKSPVTIRSLQLLREMNEDPFPAVIVCPNSLKYTVWEREFRKWAPELSLQVIDGPIAKRRKQFKDKSDVYILNWELLRIHSRLAPFGTTKLTAKQKEPKELNTLGHRSIVMDEAHRLGSVGSVKKDGERIPKSLQAQAAWATAHSAAFRFALTGTPIADNVGDLWGLEHGILPDWFPARTRYINRYCTPPNSPVLMADGTFTPIGEVRVGDEVLAFDRKNTPYMKLSRARVTAVNRRQAPLISVKTESGKQFECTPDHEWLDAVKHLERRVYAWDVGSGRRGSGRLNWKSDFKEFWALCSCGLRVNSGNKERHVRSSGHMIIEESKSIPDYLKPPKPLKRKLEFRVFRSAEVDMKLVKITNIPPPLTPEQQQKAYWLGGIFDGEGSATASSITFSQSRDANGDVYYAIYQVLKELGFDFRKTDKNFTIRGGREEYFKFLHYCRPVKASAMLNGSRYRGLAQVVGKGRFQSDRIIDIVPAGEGEVVSLSTTTGTYIVHGYASSNCEISLSFWGGREVIGLKNSTAEEFYKIVDPTFRRIPKRLALPQLPARLPIQYRHTPMTERQAELYQQMEQELIAMLDNEGGYVAASSALAQLTRLQQFASASAVLDEQGNVKLSAPSSKVNDLVDLLEEMGEEPLVVASVSRQLIYLAASKLENLHISHGLITGRQSSWERQDAVDAFQKSKIRVILLTLGAGAEGITLTRADTMLFMNESWRMLENVQARGRIDRIGAEHHSCLRFINQITPGTVEERKPLILAGKADRAEEILRDKVLLRRLLGREDLAQ